jgi:hypothetical protein
MTELISLPIVAGGIGAAVSTSQLNAKKTLLATGLSGTVIIEASNDGIHWCQIASFSGSVTDKIVTVAAAMMRVNSSSGNVASAQVIAERGVVRSGIIPVPPSNGPGAALDVTDFGCLTTIIVGDFSGSGSVNVEVSGDGVEWSTLFSFNGTGCQTKDVSAKFIRAVGNSASASLAAASEEPGTSTLTAPADAYVFRPGATGDDAPGGNVYTDWEELYAALQSTRNQGPRTLYFDGRFSGEFDPDGAGLCTIPEGVWDMKEVTWTCIQASSPFGVAQQTTVTWADFAFCPNLERIGAGNYWHNGIAHSPLTSGAGLGVIEGSNTVFFNDGPNATPLPMFRLPDDLGVVFFSLGVQVKLGAGLSQNPLPAPLIDTGNNFCIHVCFGVDVRDNAFAGTGGASFSMPLGMAGAHDWQFPALTSFISIARVHGGRFMDTRSTPSIADFTARTGQVRRIDTEAGPVEVTMPTVQGVTGDVLTLIDSSGNCGLHPARMVGASPIDKPYLNRPFQAKTWVSFSGFGGFPAKWLLVHDSSEDFIDDLVAGPASVPAVNNATNVANTEPGAVTFTFPLAADAIAGSKIIVVERSGIDPSAGITTAPSGGDTIIDPGVSKNSFKTWQSDGVDTWIRIA